MPGVSRRRFDVCRPRHSRAGGYFLLRQGLAERLQGTVPLCGQGAGPARLVAAGDAAEVLTHRRVGHFTIIAAVAPFLRFLLPAPQRTAPHRSRTSVRNRASQCSAAICCGARLHPCAGRPIGQSSWLGGAGAICAGKRRNDRSASPNCNVRSLRCVQPVKPNRKTREDMLPMTLTQPKHDDAAQGKSSTNDIVKRIRKLRWMGMDDEAERLQRELTERCSDSDCVIATPRETD